MYGPKQSTFLRAYIPALVFSVIGVGVPLLVPAPIFAAATVAAATAGWRVCAAGVSLADSSKGLEGAARVEDETARGLIAKMSDMSSAEAQEMSFHRFSE